MEIFTKKMLYEFILHYLLRELSRFLSKVHKSQQNMRCMVPKFQFPTLCVLHLNMCLSPWNTAVNFHTINVFTSLNSNIVTYGLFIPSLPSRVTLIEPNVFVHCTFYFLVFHFKFLSRRRIKM